MIKLVAFDWNGTLLADTNACVKAESKARKYFGYRPTTVKELQKTFDIPIKKYWLEMGMKKSFFNKNSDKIQHEFYKHYEPLESHCRSRAGAKKLLLWLQGEKINAVIYSNHKKAHIFKQLRRLKISHLVDGILARAKNDNSHVHFRNKEYKLKKFIDKNNIKPKEIISVGDTIEEIEIGKKLKVHTIALTGGYNSIKRLKAAKPDFIIHNLNQTIQIIKNINEQS